MASSAMHHAARERQLEDQLRVVSAALLEQQRQNEHLLRENRTLQEDWIAEQRREVAMRNMIAVYGIESLTD